MQASASSDPLLTPSWIVSTAAISHTDVFATGSNDGFVRLWQCDESFAKVHMKTKLAIPGYVNGLAMSKSGRFLVAAVGQEHKLGRWSPIKTAKNGLAVAKLPLNL